MANGLALLAMAAQIVQDSDKLQSSVKEISIRAARSTDIPLLEYVEKSAAEIFRTVNLDFLINGPTVDPSLLAFMAISNNLMVAVNRWDHPIGFAGGQNVGGHFHIVEVSVAQEYQGKGVGTALLFALLDAAKREGYRSVTLTTYRNVPFNGPWYSKMGFREVQAMDLSREYMEIMEHEAQNGLDVDQRCVMFRMI
jgi:GNAT superfamily N-acetyltransferase